jgi:hypothetical protein
MSELINFAIAVIGIDIGKNSFHVIGQDHRGANEACSSRRAKHRPAPRGHESLGYLLCVLFWQGALGRYRRFNTAKAASAVNS